MAVNGKAKGSSFERKIANLLSDRFKSITGIEQSFRRNPDSGSFFGGSNKRRTETHDLDYAIFGDLICPKNFKFSVECKFYKQGPTFAAIVKGDITQWDDWLKQAKQDSELYHKGLMLIMKYNGISEVVLTEQQYDNITSVMPYKGFYLYKLSEFLTLKDEIFFNI